VKKDMQTNSENNEPAKSVSAKAGGRAVLKLKKSITYENCGEIKDQIHAQTKNRNTEIILDCKDVPYLDSAALELLLATHNELRSKGSVLKISYLNEVCRDILKATRLINSLYVYEDMHKAVTSRP